MFDDGENLLSACSNVFLLVKLSVHEVSGFDFEEQIGILHRGDSFVDLKIKDNFSILHLVVKVQLTFEYKSGFLMSMKPRNRSTESPLGLIPIRTTTSMWFLAEKILTFSSAFGIRM